MARRRSLLTIFLIVFVDLVGFGIVLPNLQLYGQRFGISNYFALTLIAATYSLFQFVFAPILGSWSDHIGRRPVLLLSQCGTLIGFLVLFAANFFHGPQAWLGITLIFGSRVLDGISGGNISIANAYIADITTPENRAKGMGVIGAAFGLGFVFGPFLGGTVGKTLGVQYVPLIAAVFSLSAILMTYFTLAESLVRDAGAPHEKPRRFSVGGLKRALSRPIVAPLIIMFFVNGFAFAGMEGTFSLLIQHRFFPIAAMRTAADKRSGPGQVKFTGRKALRTINVKPRPIARAKFRPLGMSVKQADSDASWAAGILFGCIGIVIVLFQGGLVGRLAKRFGERKLVITGPMVIGAGLLLVALPIHWAWRWTGFAIGGALLAAGSALFTPSVQSLISRNCSPSEQGEILGANQGMASLARALGPAAAGLLFQWVSPESPYYLSTALVIVVSIWALMMGKNLKPPVSTTAPADDRSPVPAN